MDEMRTVDLSSFQMRMGIYGDWNGRFAWWRNGAEAYCRWMSEMQGMNYVLPTDLEGEGRKRVDERWFVWAMVLTPATVI